MDKEYREILADIEQELAVIEARKKAVLIMKSLIENHDVSDVCDLTPLELQEVNAYFLLKGGSVVKEPDEQDLYIVSLVKK